MIQKYKLFGRNYTSSEKDKNQFLADNYRYSRFFFVSLRKNSYMNPVVYIQVPSHIRQWAYHAYGNPVVFPPIGNEVAVLRRFSSRPPQVLLPPEEAESMLEAARAETSKLHRGLESAFEDEEYAEQRWLTHPDDYMAISMPDCKTKPAREFCYLGPRARRAVREMVCDLFKMDLWALIKDIPDRTCRMSFLISAWCEQHGIGIDYEDTVRQCFYRMRDQHTKKGVNLKSLKRICKD